MNQTQVPVFISRGHWLVDRTATYQARTVSSLIREVQRNARWAGSQGQGQEVVRWNHVTCSQTCEPWMITLSPKRSWRYHGTWRRLKSDNCWSCCVSSSCVRHFCGGEYISSFFSTTIMTWGRHWKWLNFNVMCTKLMAQEPATFYNLNSKRKNDEEKEKWLHDQFGMFLCVSASWFWVLCCFDRVFCKRVVPQL